MKLEEIFAGESKNLEFKESLPVKSSKYMKTIVAFANGQGGKLIIGVEDDTKKIVGRLQVQIEQDLSSNYISGIHLIKKSVEQFIRSVVA